MYLVVEIPRAAPPNTFAVNLHNLGVDSLGFEDKGPREARFMEYTWLDGSFSIYESGFLPANSKVAGTFYDVDVGTSATYQTNEDGGGIDFSGTVTAVQEFDRLRSMVGQVVEIDEVTENADGTQSIQVISTVYLKSVKPEASYSTGGSMRIRNWSMEIVPQYEQKQDAVTLTWVNAPLTGLTVSPDTDVTIRMTVTTGTPRFPLVIQEIDRSIGFIGVYTPSNRQIEANAGTIVFSPPNKEGHISLAVNNRAGQRISNVLTIRWEEPDTD